VPISTEEQVMAELHQVRQADQIFDRRLANIEEQLRNMSSLIERLVRVEERVTNHLDRDRQNNESITDIYRRLSAIESAGVKSGTSLAWIERFFWAAVSVAGAALASGLFK
jgi:hypothetical protein